MSTRNVGSYRIVAAIGEGGMSRVYLALPRDIGMPRRREDLIALKVMRTTLVDDPEFRGMFLTEARLTALLDHPNVVKTTAIGEDDGRFFIAMEYLEGKSLAELAELASESRETLDTRIYLRILADALVGLHYAHELCDPENGNAPMHLVHRDVSPQNLFVTYDGRCKVVDFGIAKIAGSQRTQTGVIKGKPGYIAPEQINNQRAIDRRSDIFAVGVMMFEAIAKKRFVVRPDDTVHVLARRLANDEPKIRDAAPKGTDPDILVICERAMAWSPDFRYATALELHDAIESWLSKAGATSTTNDDVARVMHKRFAADRKKARAAIDQQILVVDDSLPLLHVGKQETVTLTTRMPGGDTPPPPRVVEAVEAPAIPPAPAPAPIPLLLSPPNTDTAPKVRSSGGKKKKKRRIQGAPLLLMIVVLVGVIGVLFRIGMQEHTVTSTPIGLPSSSPSPAASGPESRLTLRVRQPPNATVTIDDRSVPRAFDGTYAKGATVRINASAPGYRAYERVVVLDRDEMIDVALVKVVDEDSQAGSPPPRLPPPSKLRIDDKDPYRR